MDVLVFVLGVSLIVANGTINGQMSGLWDLVYNPSSKTSTTDNKKTLYILGGEFAFVIILAIIARLNQRVGNLSLAFILVLWLLFLMNAGPNMGGIVSTLKKEWGL